MHFPEQPHFGRKKEAPQPSRAIRIFCALVGGLAMGCTSDPSMLSSKEIKSVHDTPLEDADTSVGSEDTSQTMDSSDSGDTGATEIDTASTVCEPHNTSLWALVGTEVGASFRDNGGSELSGITGLPGATISELPLASYGVGDEGILYEFGPDYSLNRQWPLSTPEDLEDIGIDPNSEEIFTIDEATNDVDGWTWEADADPVKTSTDCTLNVPESNLDIEGFTHLSASEAPSAWASESWKDDGGYFFAGSQSSPTIGGFRRTDCINDAALNPVFTFPTSGEDIAGLATLLGNLYVLHDSTNTVDVINMETVDLVNMENKPLTETHTLPTNGSEEGIWLQLKSCDSTTGYAEMTIADNASGEIRVYEVPVNKAY